jgi:hypothetical protein
MRRANPDIDLVTGLALLGTAAMLLVRPRHVSRIARSPLLPLTQQLTIQAGRSLAGRLAPPPRSRSQQLGRLITAYSPLRRWRDRRALTRSAGRRLNGSAALLAFSVLADSAVEHYRGSFENRAMYTPLVASTLALCASLFGTADARAKRHLVRDTIYAASAATGFAGLGFHAYNIFKRPGGMSWLNLFYAAPIGAPAALMLSGLLGRGAEQVRDTRRGRSATVLGQPAGRVLAAVTAVGLAGTVGEAGLLHFRGNFQNPAMYLPVTVPPVASVLLGAAALRPGPFVNGVARWWLRLTALLGFAGVGFHTYGISRNMGGWRNWSQNILNGPPLPAPPSFTGLALAGLAALSLLDEETDG